MYGENKEPDAGIGAITDYPPRLFKVGSGHQTNCNAQSNNSHKPGVAANAQAADGVY